ncbi:hypothetical protein BCR34DRAFT_597504 [Clohesyomyces aquaticus]|uniref:Uncharacterized protein n=1 Tax=Clohesyomyces aquaticus TaxID=1231657 RepID=A0A1Y2A2W2_9PLEO|nr:hypothetical protein BCR34DRAFT_597504 [Clohesyomyces aquaticus]
MDGRAASRDFHSSEFEHSVNQQQPFPTQEPLTSFPGGNEAPVIPQRQPQPQTATHQYAASQQQQFRYAAHPQRQVPGPFLQPQAAMQRGISPAPHDIYLDPRNRIEKIAVINAILDNEETADSQGQGQSNKRSLLNIMYESNIAEQALRWMVWFSKAREHRPIAWRDCKSHRARLLQVFDRGYNPGHPDTDPIQLFSRELMRSIPRVRAAPHARPMRWPGVRHQSVEETERAPMQSVLRVQEGPHAGPMQRPYLVNRSAEGTKRAARTQQPTGATPRTRRMQRPSGRPQFIEGTERATRTQQPTWGDTSCALTLPTTNTPGSVVEQKNEEQRPPSPEPAVESSNVPENETETPQATKSSKSLAEKAREILATLDQNSTLEEWARFYIPACKALRNRCDQLDMEKEAEEVEMNREREVREAAFLAARPELVPPPGYQPAC